MSETTKVEKRTVCPACGNKGRSVGVVTLRALLNDQHIGQFTEGAANSCCESHDATGSGCMPIGNDTGWRFCDAPTCDDVYFAEQTGATFDKSDLRVDVGVNYEKAQAVVGVEICCPIPKDQIISALRQAGYNARLSSSGESLQDLTSDVREFKDVFNEAKGQVRIVMLVSPG